MLIPYQVDVPMSRWPIGNFLLIATISLFSTAVFFDPNADYIENLVLHHWSVSGLFGHMMLHADVVHLLGNMIFLWVFGNAVCAKIGNMIYIPVFIALGLIAACVHNVIVGLPAIGASGAINGVVGMFLVFYPLNEVTCFWYIAFRGGSFSVSSMWVIFLWLAFDLWGALSGGGGAGYWAHLGGFVTGIAIAVIALLLGWVKMNSIERSLLDVLVNRGS